MTPAKPEGIDPKYLKVSYLPREGAPSRRDLLFGPLTPRYDIVPAVEAEACTAWKGCAQCLTACPQGAINLDGSAAAIDKAKCIGCGACLPACPVGAIRQPLLDPECLAAELSALLPGILLLVAHGGPSPEAPEGVRQLRLPSIGAVSPWLLLMAFTLGADGIAILPCRSGCCHGCDQSRWERALRLSRELLIRFGIEADRLLVVGREEAEGQVRLSAFAQAMAALGPHRLRGGAGTRRQGRGGLADLLRHLAALAPTPPAPLAGDGVPFGVVRVRMDRCTLCGACPERCPTNALTLQEDAGSSRLFFDHARCIACEACVRVCPERAIEVERCLEFSRLESATVLAEDEMARCDRCAHPIAPRRMLTRLGQPHAPYCPDCRILATLGRAMGKKEETR